MGDRYITIKKCPKCGSDYEVYDAPSSNMYCATCDKCGYDEGLSYYEFKNKSGSYILCLISTELLNHIMELNKIVENMQ